MAPSRSRPDAPRAGAAGDLTDDQRLKNERKVDRAAGEVKDKVGDVADKVKETVSRD
jgi:uncharacterized protein YjbJ (UPF0337 family)